jgi:putative peptidoglycan lipid II flippase
VPAHGSEQDATVGPDGVVDASAQEAAVEDGAAPPAEDAPVVDVASDQDAEASGVSVEPGPAGDAEPWWVAPAPAVVAGGGVSDHRLDIPVIEADPADPPAVVPGLPALAPPRGWDTPAASPAAPVGALGTPILPEAPTPGAESATPVARPAAGAAAAGAAAAARSLGSAARSAARATRPGLAQTRRAFLRASETIGTRAQAMVEGTGRRLEDATGRAGAFVDDVSQEFEPEDAPEERDSRAKINPAPIVLLVMVGLIIFGLVLALTDLRNASTAFTPEPRPGVSSTDEATDEPTEEPSSEPEPSQEPPPDAGASAPTIADGITFDPIVDGGENQDQAYFAYDGNPDTTWNSLRYNSPTYGMKPGLGYTVVLEETATVSRVTLRVNGEGGLVQIRAGNPTAPNEGEVLAEGALGPEVTFDLSEPIETDSISLWFPELPVSASDGRNRIELAEIQLG